MRERNEKIKIIRYGQRLIGTKDAGIIGRNTKLLIEQKTGNISMIPFAWQPLRKLIALIQFTAISKGIEAGKIDGLIGSQTRFAFEQLLYLEKHGQLAKLWREDDKSQFSKTVIRENPNDFPSYANIREVYGEPATNLKTISIPFPMRLAWDESVSVQKITCHRLVGRSLRGILKDLLDHYGLKEIRRLGIDLYGGCFNKRKMRGGKNLSTHSWGAAIDLHPAENQLRWNHKKAAFAQPEYQFLLEAFAAEGWVSLGVAKDYDWMHFQAVKL